MEQGPASASASGEAECRPAAGMSALVELICRLNEKPVPLLLIAPCAFHYLGTLAGLCPSVSCNAVYGASYGSPHLPCLRRRQHVRA